jgi:hypothetical protein
MRLNGQLNYIGRQEWFRKQEADVMIEVNFYKNRGYGTRLGFHKDTEGDNLFVNLLFNNQNAIPATEWIEDLAPTPAKLAEMRKLMPDSLRKGIARSRTKVSSGKYKLAEQGTIRGGIAPTAAFVSWTDELVWHATPSVESRLVRKILAAALVDHATLLHDVALTSALKALKGIAGTQIEKDFNVWKRRNPTASDDAFYTDYIGRDLGGTQKKKIHAQDIKAHFGTPALFAYEHNDPETGIDTDDPLFGAPTARSQTGTGLDIGKARRNSITQIDPTTLDMGPRSFLRTWVRVVRRDVAYNAPAVAVRKASRSRTYKI